MIATEEKNRVIIQGAKDFQLDHIFDNGQCFRWNKEPDGSYTGIAYGKIANIQRNDDTIVLNNVTLNDYNLIWKEYLDLERDYGALKTLLSKKDPAMKTAISYGYGMRILRQEKWETLVSFIISQNNNIPRIKKCVEGLCAVHGNPAGTYKGRTFYAFPTAEKLAGLSAEELDTCKLGYRAKYIVATAKQVSADGGKTLERMGEVSADEANEYLVSLSGVGPKVANCVSLFSMGKYSSFPLDVWIKRVMNQVYHIEEGNVKKMQEYASRHFGEYGGIAQQYLFYYTREISKTEGGKAGGKV